MSAFHLQTLCVKYEHIIIKFEQNRKTKFYLQKYHKLGYDIERMFEQKIRMEKKRTYCPLFTTIGINAKAQTVHHEM